MRNFAAALACVFTIVFVAGTTASDAAETGDHNLEVKQLEEGSINRQEGLAAWRRIHAVVSHPRCVNCHTGESNRPMWSGPEFDKPQPHGMNIHAGESRIGAETLLCQACHVTSTRPNDTPHAPPHVGIEWQLAPVEFVWFDRSEREICSQLRNPNRNGGRTGGDLVEHIIHDAELKAFITWAFDPGGGREPAPGSLQEHLDDTVTWVAAGMPCP